MIIECTEQEVNILGGLINEAIKSKGLEVAQAGLFWFNKIQEVMKKNVVPLKEDKKEKAA